MWTPTHVVVTVTKARNLLEKGKGGNDAYCMIGMGKEKFLTSVKTKTLAPVWDEQAEFNLGEREDLKLTVYHKSSIIDEFIGRVVINIAELAAFDNTHSHVGWFKLSGKPDKSDSHKKPEKERGEIEVRIDFVVKPKAGSMMDLSYKNSKEKSLSLRNLKDKSNTLKQSIGDKFKLLNKSRKSKYAGENQLAEQAKRMGGSKIDFLDGDDGSITSSYSSINGSNLQRFNDSKQVNSMSRFNPARSSFLSGSSSRLENDSSSNYGNDNTRNEDDFENESGEFDRDSANGSSFQRRNSSRFGRPAAGGAVKRQLSRRSSNLSTPFIENLNIINENSKIEINEDLHGKDNDGETEKQNDKESIHIAPLPPFNTNNSTSTPALAQRNKKERKQSNETSSKPTSPAQANPPPSQDSFASIFAASFNTTNNTTTNEKSASSNTTLTQTNTTSSSSPSSNNNITKNKNDSQQMSPRKQQAPLPPPPLPPLPQIHLQPPPLPPMPSSAVKNANAKKTSLNYSHDEDEEDHIDWASSEDEEIVKQEIETFERNQVPNKRVEINKNLESSNKNSKLEIENLIINSQSTHKRREEEKLNSLFSDLFNSKNSTNTSNNNNTSKPVKNNPLEPNLIPLANSFSIDLDPFSSTSSSTNSSFNKKTPVSNLKQTDPFGLPVDSTSKASNQKPIDPFSVFDNFIAHPTAAAAKMSERANEGQLDFSRVDEYTGETPFDADLADEKEPDDMNEQEETEAEDRKSRLVFYRPSIDIHNASAYEEEEEADDNIDNAFITYSNNTFTTNVREDDYEMTQAASELADTKLKLHEIIEEDEDELEHRSSNVVDRVVSDSDSEDSLEHEKNTTKEYFTIGNVNITSQGSNDETNQEDDEEEEEEETNDENTKVEVNSPQLRSTLSSSPDTLDETKIKGEEPNKKMDATVGSANTSAVSANTTNHNGLPDLINQKGNNDPNDKARKYLEGLDGVKFNEIQVPDQLKKQLEYFDRDELLQLIAYQKKYLDFKESRIKDLENYIDNLVVKIIEKEPSILMNASNVLSKSRNLI